MKNAGMGIVVGRAIVALSLLGATSSCVDPARRQCEAKLMEQQAQAELLREEKAKLEQQLKEQSAKLEQMQASLASAKDEAQKAALQHELDEARQKAKTGTKP